MARSKYKYPSNHYRIKWKKEVASYWEVNLPEEAKGIRRLPYGRLFPEFVTSKLRKYRAFNSGYWQIDQHIRTRWGLQTKAQNCSDITFIVDDSDGDLSFDDVIKVFNQHVFFQPRKEEAVKHIQMVRDVQENAKKELDRRNGIGSSFKRWSMVKQSQSALEFSWEEMELEFIAKEKSYNPNFSTTGFKAIERTFHPVTAPNFKQILSEDYVKMQKELGIPAEEEGIMKMFKDVGTKNIWHTYGLLASQLFHKEDKDWTVENMGWFHSATRMAEPISVKDDNEFYSFISATKRLNEVSEDKEKLFSLLIYLYEEFANDKEWSQIWDEYLDLPPSDWFPQDFRGRRLPVSYNPSFKPRSFANTLIKRIEGQNKRTKTSLTQIAELYKCEDIYDYENTSLTPRLPKLIEGEDYNWDIHIADKYFTTKTSTKYY